LYLGIHCQIIINFRTYLFHFVVNCSDKLKKCNNTSIQTKSKVLKSLSSFKLTRLKAKNVIKSKRARPIPTLSRADALMMTKKIRVCTMRQGSKMRPWVIAIAILKKVRLEVHQKRGKTTRRTKVVMIRIKTTSSTTKASTSTTTMKSILMIQPVHIFDTMISISDYSSPRSNVTGWTKNLT
jgi:hypothetical protein